MTLTIRIVPNAKRSQIIGWEDGELKIKIAAPAVDGKANAALITFLAKELDVGKSKIAILKGETSRRKIVEVPDGQYPSLSSESSPE